LQLLNQLDSVTIGIVNLPIALIRYHSRKNVNEIIPSLSG